MKTILNSAVIILAASLLLAGPALGSSHEQGAATSGGTHMGGTHMDSATMPMGEHATTASQLNTEQVRELQRLLNDRGYKAGPADGVIGSGTTEALREYQGDNGLTVTGTPDQATLRALAPSTEKQEFFGLAPAFGTMEKPLQQPAAPEAQGTMERMGTEPMKKMTDEPMKTMEQEKQKLGY